MHGGVFSLANLVVGSLDWRIGGVGVGWVGLGLGLGWMPGAWDTPSLFFISFEGGFLSS